MVQSEAAPSGPATERKGKQVAVPAASAEGKRGRSPEQAIMLTGPESSQGTLSHRRLRSANKMLTLVTAGWLKAYMPPSRARR